MKIIINEPQALCERGKRLNQEDALYPYVGNMSQKNRCFVLCDGMGGHEHGEVASTTVCQTVGVWLDSHIDAEDYSFEPKDLDNALAYAYQALDKHDNLHAEGARKMGTTMALLLLADNGCLMAHIGDSRIYHLRPKEGRVCFRTEDHTLVNDLVRSGELTEEAARKSPSRHLLTRAMQPHQSPRVKADWKLTTDVRPGDCIVLCSDGMLEHLTDDMLVRVMQESPNDSERIDRLKELTACNQDNHSCVLISIKEVKTESKNKEMGTNVRKKDCLYQKVWQGFAQMIKKT